MSIEAMSLVIAPASFAILPGLSSWAFQATGLRPCEPPGSVTDRMSDEVDPAHITAHPRIASWRDAYRAMGLKPGDHRSSVEQLVRRAAGGHSLRTGIWTVDLYNRTSLHHLAPLGGYDLDRMSRQPLVLRPGAATDRFFPLGGDPNRMRPTPRTICYAQGSDVLCWALNHRDSAETALRQHSCNAMFVSEAVDDDGARRSLKALADLAGQFRACGIACSETVRFGAV